MDAWGELTMKTAIAAQGEGVNYAPTRACFCLRQSAVVLLNQSYSSSVLRLRFTKAVYAALMAKGSGRDEWKITYKREVLDPPQGHYAIAMPGRVRAASGKASLLFRAHSLPPGPSLAVYSVDGLCLKNPRTLPTTNEEHTTSTSHTMIIQAIFPPHQNTGDLKASHMAPTSSLAA